MGRLNALQPKQHPHTGPLDPSQPFSHEGSKAKGPCVFFGSKKRELAGYTNQTGFRTEKPVPQGEYKVKGIIIYKSSGSATETYARARAKETGFDCVSAAKAPKLDLYDRVVIGSNVRMFKVTLGPWIAKRWNLLERKKPILFSVADADIASKLPHVQLNGKMIFADLPPFDRGIMNLAVKMTANKNPAQTAEMAREYDGVNLADLAPLTELIKKG